MFFAKGTPDFMQRLPCLPTTPHVALLLAESPNRFPGFINTTFLDDATDGERIMCITKEWKRKKRALLWLPFLPVVGLAFVFADPLTTYQAVAIWLEEQWLQPQNTNNPDLVAPLLADKFVNTSIERNVSNKAETLANAKATKYVSADYEDVKVAVFGNTAIATGVFKATGTDASGKPMDTHELWTDTWVKMPSGKWQCVATHRPTIKM